MTDLPFDQSIIDSELDERLRDLAAHVAFPPTPALSRSVINAIQAHPSRNQRVHPRLAVAFILVLMIVFTAVAAVPAARHAVARWIDIPGIHLSWLDEDPPANIEAEIRLGLGNRITIDETMSQADFPISLPADDRANEPDEIFYNSSPASGPSFPPGVVSFVYYANSDLPAVPGTDVGLLITEFEGDTSSIWANKSLMIDDDPRTVRVNGADGLWLPDTHLISIQPESAGDILTPATRSTGSVLIWNRDGITYRIEGNLPYDAMLEIAESMEPIAP